MIVAQRDSYNHIQENCIQKNLEMSPNHFIKKNQF